MEKLMKLDNKKVLITGGNSMIGISLVRELSYRKNIVISTSSKEEYNLLSWSATSKLFNRIKPDIVVHLATYSGNIQFNQKYPADTFYRTSQIGLNVLNMCQEYKVEKVLSILSSCSVADRGLEELKESDLHNGPPNPSIECHGYAKRILDIYSRQLNKQYGLNAICAIVNNSFGPYDSFSPEKTKVIGAMIKRFVDAKEQKLPFVECWGSGKALREFIYCKDVAKLLILALEKYNDCSIPINIGSTNEVSIKQLAETAAKVADYKGEIRWLLEKGDGQLRKKLDLTRMSDFLLGDGSFTYTDFEEALRETTEWYINTREWWHK